MEFKLNGVGFDHKHDHKFRIERPYGSGDYLFLFYSTEITVDFYEKKAYRKTRFMYYLHT